MTDQTPEQGPFSGERGEPIEVNIPEGEPPLDPDSRPKILVPGIEIEEFEPWEKPPTSDDQRESLEDVPLSRCDISFLINVRNVNSLLEAVDIAAANLGRYGMDSFYILATDPDTGRQWILSNGELQEAEDVIQRLEDLQKEAGDDSD